LVAGEAIHQLRSSLDHLAWQLVEANGGTPGTHTGFPIHEVPPKDKRAFTAKVKGMSTSAENLVEATQPYHSRNDGLWKLSKLDNFDKHNLLLVVGYGLCRFGFGYTHPALRTEDGQAFLRDILAPHILLPSDNIPPPKRLPMFKDGAEVFRLANMPQLDYQLDCPFEVAFAKPEIVEGETVLPLLHDLTKLVESVVNSFVPFL
jgi:hypothetical protein